MKAIHEVLAPLDLPVCHPPYTGAERQFITYTLINNAYNDWASGAAFEEETVYSVDLFTKDAYEDLAKQIKALLRAEGYVVTEGPELYESDSRAAGGVSPYRHIVFDVTCWDGVGLYG